MSTAREVTSASLVNALLADGMTKSQIAKAIGRDSSVVSQIASGKKPYTNLVPTLSATLANRRGEKVPVPEAPRRLNAQGQQAQVRKPTAGGRTVHVRSAGAIKAGAKSIANRLAAAARDGKVVAWTVTFPGTDSEGQPFEVSKSPKLVDADLTDLEPEPDPEEAQQTAAAGKPHRAAPGAGVIVVEIANSGNGYPAAMFDRMVQASGGNVTSALVGWMVRQGMMPAPAVPLSIELRTWTPRQRA